MFKKSVFVIAFTLALGAIVNFAGCEKSSGQLDWPEVTNQTMPWSRWWWMGSAVDKENLTAAMEEYAKAGLGGLEITPIYGVKGSEDKFINYLTPEWMEMLTHTLKEAERLDMGIDMATGNGWPFGGLWVGAEDACKNMTYKTYRLNGGQRLDEAVEFIQKPLVRTIGRRVNISEVIEPLSENKDLQTIAFEQVRFEKKLPLAALMGYSDTGEVVNLTDKVKDNGLLDWTTPEGAWTLYAVFTGWHGKMVERAGPGGEGNVIDHFSEKALKNYLGKFDKAFEGYDVGSLRAYFNDSYEVDDASGQSNWTPEFFDEFAKRRGYDLRENLPALFGKDSQEKNTRVLCDYRETISDLLLEEFTIPWRQWAQGKEAITRNQAHGSPANILDLYAASGIPETEGADIIKFKAASSAAHVTGKSLASAEAATWLDEHFCASLADVKNIVDSFFLGEINHICYHGTNYSPKTEDWPGWLFYASVHFGPTNTIWRDLGTLNSYVTRCQSFLQAGAPDEDVLLYFPIYDQWSQAGRNMLVHFDGSADGTAVRRTGQELLAKGFTFDFVSDRQLKNVEFGDNSLQAGGNRYKAIVVPQCRFMPVDTFEKLAGLAEKGAVIIVQGTLPADVPGWAKFEKKREKLQQLCGELAFEKAENSGFRKASAGSGMFLLGEDLKELVKQAGIKPERMVEQGLEFVRRRDGESFCYFIVNRGNEKVNGWIPINTGAKAAAVFEPMSAEKGAAAVRDTKDGTEVYLQLERGQACIVKTFEINVSWPAYKYVKAKGEPQEIKGTWKVEFIEGGPELPKPAVTDTLVSWTEFGGEAAKNFSGTAKYSTTFSRPAGEYDALELKLAGVCKSARVKLNGREIAVLVGPVYKTTIDSSMIKDTNVLEVEVTNLMANHIAEIDRQNVGWKKFYNVNFPARRPENRGRDGLFNASGWQAKESGLTGPVTLEPVEYMDFGK